MYRVAYVNLLRGQVDLNVSDSDGGIKASVLVDRAVLRLSGGDRATFLQGLVTADISGLANGEACWAALLTPQGKILFDFLVVEQGDDTLIDCARDQLTELAKRFAFYSSGLR